MTDTELKPCPFCGGSAELVEEHDHAWVRHDDCPFNLVGFVYASEAVATWNRRVEANGLTTGEAWEELCSADDRTSPEEYPDMCLITREELAEFMRRATETRIRSCLLDKPEAVEGVRDSLETAKTQIIAAYRVWVADDVTAFPTPMSQAGEAISKIDRALSSLKGDRA